MNLIAFSAYWISPGGRFESNLWQILIQQHLHRIGLQHVPPPLQRVAVGLLCHPPLERHKRCRVHVSMQAMDDGTEAR